LVDYPKWGEKENGGVACDPSHTPNSRSNESGPFKVFDIEKKHTRTSKSRSIKTQEREGELTTRVERGGGEGKKFEKLYPKGGRIDEVPFTSVGNVQSLKDKGGGLEYHPFY